VSTTALWRTGRKNPYTIYAQLGAEPSDDDDYLGSLNTPELSAEAVRAHNAALQLRDLLNTGLMQPRMVEDENVVDEDAVATMPCAEPDCTNRIPSDQELPFCRQHMPPGGTALPVEEP